MPQGFFFDPKRLTHQERLQFGRGPRNRYCMRSILCLPILARGRNVFAVAELLNAGMGLCGILTRKPPRSASSRVGMASTRRRNSDFLFCCLANANTRDLRDLWNELPAQRQPHALCAFFHSLKNMWFRKRSKAHMLQLENQQLEVGGPTGVFGTARFYSSTGQHGTLRSSALRTLLGGGSSQWSYRLSSRFVPSQDNPRFPKSHLSQTSTGHLLSAGDRFS